MTSRLAAKQGGTFIFGDMTMNHAFKQKSMMFLLMLAIAPAHLWAEESATPGVVPVNLEQFPTAETHHMMKVSIATLDSMGQWAHARGFTPIDQQNVVRMNRDTLYSSLVLDLTEPATVIKPDTQGRYQSILVINEENFAKLIAYKPGEYELTQENMGSRYVAIIGRTLVDMEDPADVTQAHEAQDGLQVTQKAKGSLDVPNWDPDALGKIRETLKVLGQYLPTRDTAFGANIDEVDPVAHLIGSADTWGGWKPENAVYQNFVPQQNDGTTPYTLTLKDVPAREDAFWSVSVYNEDGYFEKNEFDKYVINSRKAQANEDGSFTIHFGGDSSQSNFLPISPGWNYMIRIYLPQAPYFDKTWKPDNFEIVR